MAKSRDRVGGWFQILDERGHSDRAQIFLERLDGARGMDFSFPHRQMDGAARMAQVLQQFGVPYTQPKPMARPSIVRRVYLFLRGLLGNSHSPRPNWRQFDILKGNISFELNWLLLHPTAEQQLRELARAEKVSVNSLVMEVLSTEIARRLGADPETFEGSWMFPVSMRGAFVEKIPAGNKVSYFALRTKCGTPAKALHAQIKDGFRHDVHWSNWLVYRGLTFLGMNLMRKISKWSAGKVFWIGTFSDLGNWTPPEGVNIMQALRERVWVAAPVGTPNTPVSSASAQWYGRRTISLRVHPCICAESSFEMAREILDAVAKNLCGRLSVPESEITLRASRPLPSRLDRPELAVGFPVEGSDVEILDRMT